MTQTKNYIQLGKKKKSTVMHFNNAMQHVFIAHISMYVLFEH